MSGYIDDRTEFEAQTAASVAVMDWLDADEYRAVIGCTPAMVAQIAVNAYRQARDAAIITTTPELITDGLADIRACAAYVSDGPTHLQVLKLSEEAGEAAAAYIGWTGNPRPGKESTRDDFIKEVCDVALTAMVALENIGEDSRQRIAERAADVRRRFES